MKEFLVYNARTQEIGILFRDVGNGYNGWWIETDLEHVFYHKVTDFKLENYQIVGEL